MGFAQDLEAVADAEHRQPGPGRGDQFGHDRGEPRDGPAAQVVAVGEATGQDDRVHAVQVVLVMPEGDGIAAGPLDGPGGLLLVEGSGERDDTDARGHRTPQETLRDTPEDYRLLPG